MNAWGGRAESWFNGSTGSTLKNEHKNGWRFLWSSVLEHASKFAGVQDVEILANKVEDGFDGFDGFKAVLEVLGIP